jgi:hypothetical protein
MNNHCTGEVLHKRQCSGAYTGRRANVFIVKLRRPSQIERMLVTQSDLPAI